MMRNKCFNNDLTYRKALEVYEKLSEEDKKWVSPKTYSTYRYVIKNKAFIDITPYNLQNDIGFINIAVLQEYRRMGLTKKLLKKTIDYCKEIGVKELIWSCSCENDISFKTALNNGFELVHKGKLYCKLRYEIL